jgi:glycerol-3-phosphate dehydrogenase (NAD(P)+)
MQSAHEPTLVLGAGSWGTALALVLARNKQMVHLWDHNKLLLEGITKDGQNTRYVPGVPFPKNILVCQELSAALVGVRDILIVVPSHAFREALQILAPWLTEQHRIIWATKGLDPSGLFLHEVAEQELGSKRAYAVLSGPSFAKEVALGLPTAVAVAANDKVFTKDIVQKFQKEPFLIYTTNDLTGVELGGVVKNVLAVLIGIADGLELGANARAALITEGLAEMRRLGKVLGAKKETLMGLAGCGDVILTCTDNQSRNRRFGLALAKGLSEEEALRDIGQVVEAVYNIEQLYRLAEKHGIELPIVDKVFQVMKKGAAPKEALLSLFRKKPKSELFCK